MDHRGALKPGSILDFPGMPCTLEDEIGRGSNAIVYRAYYPDLLNREERHTVLIKELFPFHRKGAIYRDETGDIVCEADGLETMDLHRRSFEYGNLVHLRMLAMHPDQTGANLNTFSLHGTSYTVLGCTGGRMLAQAAAGEAEDLRKLTLRMLGLMDALDAFHESGFLHLDIAPDNILLVGRGAGERVMLIDYNSVVSLSRSSAPVYYSIKQGYSAPEIRSGRSPSAASDLYSAAAVFFRCLTGKPLTPFQASRPAPPDVSECALLRKYPDTVADMAGQILRRGLQALPQRRYQTVAQMREALQELLDRIDGIGITHWALWESGRRMAGRIIRDNPALTYIRSREELFPANIRGAEGESLPVNDFIQASLSFKRGTAVLTAPGGMGKTTALLRAAADQSGAYSPDRPAIFYLSLYGWKPGDPAYLHNRILNELRFKPEQKSIEDARHALDRLLDEPLYTRWGERPILLLLLDGLNEAVGETQPLVEEILHLSRMGGVSILVTTRSEEAVLPFANTRLEPLPEEEVSKRLARFGILPPEIPEMRELLRTPLMLSIFLQSALTEQKQLPVQTREELIEAYFDSLMSKELNSLPEDTEARWQIDAALSFVLPAISGEVQKRGRALSDRELLPVIERCYRCFSSRLLRRAFPRWIGHSRAIRGEAANAEEWYGLLVHGLLWKRLGLLVRNEQNAYQVSHQILADYLAGLNAQNQTRLWKRRRIGMVMLIAALLAASAAFGGVCQYCFKRPPYSVSAAADVLSFGLNGYMEAGRQYEAIRGLLDCAADSPSQYQDQLDLSEASVNPISQSGDLAEMALQRMLDSGEVMPGTNHGMDEDAYRELVGLLNARGEEYARYMTLLTYVMEDERANRLYRIDEAGRPGFPGLFSDLVETDADIACALYRIVCEPYISDTTILSQQELEQSRKMLSALDSGYSYRGEVSETDSAEVLLKSLHRQREEAVGALERHPVNTIFELEESS